ncbi:hypothetical protein NLU13_4096 [Sarocladium strictum]|uniref:Uncharacterized protein n=1 Tax=Sarocladium strictum TaxID=5046 RepID=A0AA39GIW1_SARSR|nr:hypothetical protein NLU13_4096 [Sarocladium strictum]
MFRFRKTLDIITLFHKPNNPASTRVATLLKQASANAQAEATIDQASDHSNQTSPARDDFELNITEDAPTQDQVQTILEYVGKNKIQSVIKGARDQKDALQKFKENKDSFQRPIVVDWNNGKAVVGDNESEILKLVKASNTQ